MKKFTVCMALTLLLAGCLTGCRTPGSGTATTTRKEPAATSSTLRPQPTATLPTGTTQIPATTSPKSHNGMN